MVYIKSKQNIWCKPFNENIASRMLGQKNWICIEIAEEFNTKNAKETLLYSLKIFSKSFPYA